MRRVRCTRAPSTDHLAFPSTCTLMPPRAHHCRGYAPALAPVHACTSTATQDTDIALENYSPSMHTLFYELRSIPRPRALLEVLPGSGVHELASSPRNASLQRPAWPCLAAPHGRERACRRQGNTHGHCAHTRDRTEAPGPTLSSPPSGHACAHHQHGMDLSRSPPGCHHVVTSDSAATTTPQHRCVFRQPSHSYSLAPPLVGLVRHLAFLHEHDLTDAGAPAQPHGSALPPHGRHEPHARARPSLPSNTWCHPSSFPLFQARLAPFPLHPLGRQHAKA